MTSQTRKHARMQQQEQFAHFKLSHTDPPAARAVRSSSNRSPSFPALVRVSLINDGPPDIKSCSSDLLRLSVSCANLSTTSCHVREDYSLCSTPLEQVSTINHQLD